MSKTSFFSDFILIVGGYGTAGRLDTVEVVSPDPVSNPVSLCTRTLRNFPTALSEGPVGTTFSKFFLGIEVMGEGEFNCK